MVRVSSANVVPEGGKCVFKLVHALPGLPAGACAEALPTREEKECQGRIKMLVPGYSRSCGYLEPQLAVEQQSILVFKAQKPSLHVLSARNLPQAATCQGDLLDWTLKCIF